MGEKVDGVLRMGKGSINLEDQMRIFIIIPNRSSPLGVTCFLED